ncbi:MAG: hypothetical protein KIT84_18290 [Labilithrix sp.]|nr:hypothetical protein [Labilithrix sp.]MCW5812983.1 hypothetical protein [Labilithrix sp.]
MVRPVLLLAFLVGSLAACDGAGDGPPARVLVEGSDDAEEAAAAANDPAAPAEEEPKGPFPIVLLHGMGGFVETEGLIKVKMFQGVPEDLTKNGNQVFQTLSQPYDTSEQRAKMIVEQLETIMKNTGAKKVNLIGHSQGGLDARVIASPGGLGLGKKIASISTVATPHLGSGVADFALGITARVPDGVIDKGSDVLLGIAQKRMSDLDDDPALRAQVTELSTPHMRDVFNPKYTDDPGVKYFSWAGRTNKQTGAGVCDDGEQPNDPNDVRRVSPNLLATVKILEDGQGKANDGLVTVENAKWGKFQRCVPADHNAFVIGQGGFDQVAFFRDVVARIRKDGL